MPKTTDPARDLLFGLLALQNGLIDQGALFAAFAAWTRDRARSLADHLFDLGHLDAPRRAAVEAIAGLHIQALGGDPAQSLAVLTVDRSTRESLARAGGPDVLATLGHVGSTQGPTFGDDGTDRTGSYSVGSATSDGQRFRILRPHARGGLGAVFVALDSELDREVALKQILDDRADDPSSRYRFVIEAQITGGLEHPGIVPVYGLGAHGDGRPYYAMRFIRGDSLKEAIDQFHERENTQSLAAFPSNQNPGAGPDVRSGGSGKSARAPAASHDLALRKLLRRFMDVCNAIEYAHSRGVIHRDIKPANIIVGKHGETLVVDWGLAKPTGRAIPGIESGERLLMPSSASGSSETLPGSALGTPAYMSPEQAEGQLEPLGPRSDVYSLGATLYYLLTGQPPFNGELFDVIRAVRRGNILPPRQLDPRIDPALEAICLKAMAHRPENRYPSSRALSDDLDRWMADEPVSAWREPLSRRARRWARRNRTAVTAAAAAVVAGVFGLTAVLAVQTQAKAALAKSLERETIANAELTRSRIAVQARYDLAVDAIKTFHTGVSEDFLLKEEKFKDLRDRLLRSASEFYGRLGALLGKESDTGSRRAFAAANFELAELTGKVGQKEAALEAHRQVLAFRESLAAEPGADAEARAEVGRSLIAIGRQQEAIGKTTEAQSSYDAARSLLAVLVNSGRDDLAYRADLATVEFWLGLLSLHTGKTPLGLQLLQQSRESREKLVEREPGNTRLQSELGMCYFNEGWFLLQTGKPAEALQACEKALKIQQRLADANPGVAQYQSELASSYHVIGAVGLQSANRMDALEPWRKALAIRQKLVDANPGVTQFQRILSVSHYNLGILFSRTKNPRESLESYGKAVEIQRRLVDANPSVTSFQNDLARSYNSIGFLQMLTGNSARALASWSLAAPIQQKLVDANPGVPGYVSDLALSYRNIGQLLTESGNPAAALESYRKAVSLCSTIAETNSEITEYREDLASSLEGLASTLTQNGDRASEAEATYRKALELLRKLADDKPTVVEFRAELAACHTKLGRLLATAERTSEAEAEYRNALAIQRKLADANPKSPGYRGSLASTYTNIADIVRSLGRPAEARDGYEWAIALGESLIEEDPKTGSYRGGLAFSLRRRGLARRELGDLAGAAADAKRALALYDSLPSRSGDEWFETACCHATLATLAGRNAAGDLAIDAALEAETAMALLAKAVAMGDHGYQRYQTEAALGSLRDRPDFQLLLMDLRLPTMPFAR